MGDSLSIFCDGGALGNPGPAASAFVVFQAGKVIYKFAKKIGHTTNNVAEYEAVIAALEWLRDQSSIINHKQSLLLRNQSINFFLDSQLVVNQLNGLFKIKAAKLRLLIIKAKTLEQELPLKIYYHHVRREKNKFTDALVRNALLKK